MISTDWMELSFGMLGLDLLMNRHKKTGMFPESKSTLCQLFLAEEKDNKLKQ